MTLKQGSKVKFNTCKKDLQTMISNILFSHSKPPWTNDKGDMRAFDMPPLDIMDVIWWSFCFQNKAKTRGMLLLTKAKHP